MVRILYLIRKHICLVSKQAILRRSWKKETEGFSPRTMLSTVKSVKSTRISPKTVHDRFRLNQRPSRIPTVTLLWSRFSGKLLISVRTHEVIIGINPQRRPLQRYGAFLFAISFIIRNYFIIVHKRPKFHQKSLKNKSKNNKIV